MSFFRDWHEARAHAQERANAIGVSHGVLATSEYGRKGFSVRMLPKPENCYGLEARAERVEPEVRIVRAIESEVRS